EVAIDVRGRRDVLRPLAHGLRSMPDAQARPEDRVDAALEVEELVPRVEPFEDVREVHVRALPEVAAAQVDVAERLEVRDLPRPQVLRLRRGEAKEELGGLRDQVGAG